MSEDIPAPPLPGLFLLAAAAPTFLAVGLEVLGVLGAFAPPSLKLTMLLWAFATLPLVLLVLGLQQAIAHGAALVDPQVKKVMRSLAKSEEAALLALQALAKLQAQHRQIQVGETPPSSDGAGSDSAPAQMPEKSA